MNNNSSPYEQNQELIVTNIIHTLNTALSEHLLTFDASSEKTFYEFLKKSKVDFSAFSYNWPYVVQSTRNRGFYYGNKKSIIYLYFRFTLVSKEVPDLIVVNQLGSDPETLVNELANSALKLGIQTILKNIDLEKVSFLSKFGFAETIQPWSKYAFRNDNTFPEYVYDIKKFRNAEFTRTTQQLIRQLSKGNFKLKNYNKSLKNEGMKLLEKTAEYLEKKGVDSKKEIILAHEFVFSENIVNKIVLSIFENETLVGISYMTHVGDTLFFNAVINENRPNLMRFLLWKSVVHYCENLDETQKPLFLALQGSENNNQNKWKEYFHPIRSISRVHLTNMPLKVDERTG